MGVFYVIPMFLTQYTIILIYEIVADSAPKKKIWITQM